MVTGRTRRVTFSGSFNLVGQTSVTFFFFLPESTSTPDFLLTSSGVTPKMSLTITGGPNNGYQAVATMSIRGVATSQTFNWIGTDGASAALLPTSAPLGGGSYYSGRDWTPLSGTFEGYLDLQEDSTVTEQLLVSGNYHIGMTWNPGTVSFDGTLPSVLDFTNTVRYGHYARTDIPNLGPTYIHYNQPPLGSPTILGFGPDQYARGDCTFLGSPVNGYSFDSGKIERFSPLQGFYLNSHVIDGAGVSISSGGSLTGTTTGPTLPNFTRADDFLIQPMSVHTKIYTQEGPYPGNATVNINGGEHIEVATGGEINYLSPGIDARGLYYGANFEPFNTVRNQLGQGGNITAQASYGSVVNDIYYICGPVWSPFTISQDEEHVIGAPGSYSPVLNSSGYRFLCADASAPVSLRVKGPGFSGEITKNFTDVDPIDGKVYFDLCGGDDPLHNVSTISSGPAYGSLWGLDSIDSIAVISGTTSNFKLVRRKSAKIHASHPLTGLSRASIDVDGKRAQDIASSTLAYWTFTGLGWHITNTPNPAWYAVPSQIQFIGSYFGHGVTIDQSGSPTYWDNFTLPSSLAVPIQYQNSQGIGSYPGMGDFLYAGPYGPVTHVEAKIVAGKIITGIVIDTDALPVEGATVTALFADSSTVTTVTDELGIYAFPTLDNKAITLSVEDGFSSASLPLPGDRIQRVAFRGRQIVRPPKARPAHFQHPNGSSYAARISSGGDLFAGYSRFYFPAFGFQFSSQVTHTGKVDSCSIWVDLGTARAWLLWGNEDSPGVFNVYTAYSDDRTASWSTPLLVMSNARYPVGASASNGSQLRAVLIFDSGTSGPASIWGQYMGRGDLAFGSLIEFKDSSGNPIKVADASGWGNVQRAYAGHAPWIMYIVYQGDTDPSWWSCNDIYGMTWSRIS